MKHAFIFGTSIYLSNHRTISYNDGHTSTVFLTIRNFYNPQNNAPDHELVIDADINTVDDHHQVKVTSNMVQQGSDVSAVTEPNRVKLYHTGHAEPILDVYQLDPHEYHGLSSHILNEINSQHPGPVFIIKGNFTVSGAHIYIENEKMLVDHDTFANGVENAHDGVVLLSSEKVHGH
ncbi:MAG: hypothetical protein V4592_02105 [Bacteroidota bacterium]